MEGKTRYLELTHDEIVLIKNALQYVYDRKMDSIKKNEKIMESNEQQIMLNSANKYFNLQDEINSGGKDV